MEKVLYLGTWVLMKSLNRNLVDAPEIDSSLHGAERGNTKRILYYNPAVFQSARHLQNLSYFHKCKVNNCKMSFEQKEADISDAVIIDWRTLIYKPNFTRPKDQVWIFIQHEAPPVYWGPYPIFYENMKLTFNWTMTYSKQADIYLPYGKLEPRTKTKSAKRRNFTELASSKTKDAVWVVSHCHTDSKRELYVETLKHYIGVETLGACGKPWCGKAHNHELGDCFSVLNTSYKYYLAFENNLCEDYITEKFFENYKYDILLVVRGGKPRERPIEADEPAYISTSDFPNAHALGFYLRDLKRNWTLYAKMLAAKEKYKVVTYSELFQRAMCDVCERLHNLNKYRKTYKDVYKWMQTKEQCFHPYS